MQMQCLRYTAYGVSSMLYEYACSTKHKEKDSIHVPVSTKSIIRHVRLPEADIQSPIVKVVLQASLGICKEIRNCRLETLIEGSESSFQNTYWGGVSNSRAEPPPSTSILQRISIV